MQTQRRQHNDQVKVLVPVDGSAAANQAVDYAIWCAGAMSNVSILLLNVQNRDTLQLSDILPLTDDEQSLSAAAASAEVLHPARERCLAAGVHAESRAAFGPIAATIAQVSRKAKVDLVIMGTHGRSRLGAAVLGSTAAEVLHRVHVPVTLLKQGERHWA
ncbi:universal stress protein [Methylobacterium sp. CM6257]